MPSGKTVMVKASTEFSRQRVCMGLTSSSSTTEKSSDKLWMKSVLASRFDREATLKRFDRERKFAGAKVAGVVTCAFILREWGVNRLLFLFTLQSNELFCDKLWHKTEIRGRFRRILLSFVKHPECTA